MKYFHSDNQVFQTRGVSTRGFSLVEVLIAMGIFAVGFVAVAAMFPAGAVLQRETVANVEAQMVARNASAFMRSVRITFSPDGSFGADLRETSGSGQLQPLVSASPNVSTRLQSYWPKPDRGYPTSRVSVDDRKYYWVPFLRRTSVLPDPGNANEKVIGLAKNRTDFSMLVFVMRRDGNYKFDFPGTPYPAPAGTNANAADGPTVPKVFGVTATVTATDRFDFANRLFSQTTAGRADQVRVGDWIADNNGFIYKVKSADATGCVVIGGIPKGPSDGTVTVWYSPPPAPGAASPCVRILLMNGLVEDAVP